MRSAALPFISALKTRLVSAMPRGGLRHRNSVEPMVKYRGNGGMTPEGSGWGSGDKS